MIKKLIAVSTLAVFGATAAQADTDLLELNGQVDYQCTANMAQTSATVVIGPQYNDHVLGNITILCNDPQGFTLDVSSTNNFRLNSGPHNYVYDIRVEAPVGRTFSDNGDAPFSNSGFSAIYAAGAQARLQFVPDPGNGVLPGGVALTDSVTFTINGL